MLRYFNILYTLNKLYFKLHYIMLVSLLLIVNIKLNIVDNLIFTNIKSGFNYQPCVYLTI